MHWYKKALLGAVGGAAALFGVATLGTASADGGWTPPPGICVTYNADGSSTSSYCDGYLESLPAYQGPFQDVPSQGYYIPHIYVAPVYVTYTLAWYDYNPGWWYGHYKSHDKHYGDWWKRWDNDKDWRHGHKDWGKGKDDWRRYFLHDDGVNWRFDSYWGVTVREAFYLGYYDHPCGIPDATLYLFGCTSDYP
mgnify:CR=1 FL=1